MRCRLYGCFGAVGDLRCVAGDAGFGGCCLDEFAQALRVFGGAAGGDQFGAHMHCLACEQFEGARARREGDDLQRCVCGGGAGALERGEVVDNLHGLGADGAGRAEEGDALRCAGEFCEGVGEAVAVAADAF